MSYKTCKDMQIACHLDTVVVPQAQMESRARVAEELMVAMQDERSLMMCGGLGRLRDGRRRAFDIENLRLSSISKWPKTCQRPAKD